MFIKEGAVPCARCKQPIVFARTENGKKMPCEQDMVAYVKDPNGDARVLTKSGKIIRAQIVGIGEGSDGYGYIPHFGRCQVSADAARRLEGYRNGGQAPEKKQTEINSRESPAERVSRERGGAGQRARVAACGDARDVTLDPTYEQTSLFAPLDTGRSYRHPE